MASVIYPYGSSYDEKPYQVYKVITHKTKQLTTYHKNKGGIIIAKGNIYEGIEAMDWNMRW